MWPFSKGENPKEEPKEAREKPEELKQAYVVRTSGKVELWDIVSESADQVRLRSINEKGQVITKSMDREDFDRMNSPESRAALDALSDLKKVERNKAFFDEESLRAKQEKVSELSRLMTDVATGDYEEARAYLVREAIATGGGYGINETRIDKVREELEEKRTELEQKLKDREEKLSFIKKQLEEARKNNPERVSGLELKSVELHTDIQSLRQDKKKNFSDLQRLLDAIDGLDKLRGK